MSRRSIVKGGRTAASIIEAMEYAAADLEYRVDSYPDEWDDTDKPLRTAARWRRIAASLEADPPTARTCGTDHPAGTLCAICDAAWLAPYPGEGHDPSCHPMPCCGRMDCEPHTADCPVALAQDAADMGEDDE